MAAPMGAVAMAAAGVAEGMAPHTGGGPNGASTGSQAPQAGQTPQAGQASAEELPPDELFSKTFFGDDFLKTYQKDKKDLASAHEAYVKTGKIPQASTHFTVIEIKEGKAMSRAERYDAMVAAMNKKQGGAGESAILLGDVENDNRDPDYLTKEEFHDEFWAREKKEYNACEDDYIRPGKIDKCQREVDEKYGGESFKDWRDKQEEAAYHEYQKYQEKVEGVANSGPGGLVGRVVGRAIGGEKGEEWGAAIGGLGDTIMSVGAEMRGKSVEESGGGPDLDTGRPDQAEVGSPPDQHPDENMPSPPPDSKGGPTSDIGNADTQPAPAQVKKPGGDTQDTNPPKGGDTQDTNPPKAGSGGNGEKGGTLTGHPVEPVPRVPDNQKISIKTPKGGEEMTVGEYRKRWNDARKWLAEENFKLGQTKGAPPPEKLTKEAQTKFGLDDGWQSIANPYIYGKL